LAIFVITLGRKNVLSTDKPEPCVPDPAPLSLATPTQCSINGDLFYLIDQIFVTREELPQHT